MEYLPHSILIVASILITIPPIHSYVLYVIATNIKCCIEFLILLNILSENEGCEWNTVSSWFDMLLRMQLSISRSFITFSSLPGPAFDLCINGSCDEVLF